MVLGARISLWACALRKMHTHSKSNTCGCRMGRVLQPRLPFSGSTGPEPRMRAPIICALRCKEPGKAWTLKFNRWKITCRESYVPQTKLRTPPPFRTPHSGPLAHLTFATPPSPHMREQTLTSASHAITLSVTAG